jgi:hypothetical protein
MRRFVKYRLWCGFLCKEFQSRYFVLFPIVNVAFISPVCRWISKGGHKKWLVFTNAYFSPVCKRDTSEHLVSSFLVLFDPSIHREGAIYYEISLRIYKLTLPRPEHGCVVSDSGIFVKVRVVAGKSRTHSCQTVSPIDSR